MFAINILSATDAQGSVLPVSYKWFVGTWP